MIKPETLTEQLLFSTIKIINSNGGSGTGFFHKFIVREKPVIVIITNKHVVLNNAEEKVSFLLHTRTGDSISEENIPIKFETKWFFHPLQDLCFCFAMPLFEQIKKNGKDIFFKTNDDNFIWDDKKLETLSAMEDIVMVGYPNGLWDEKNNFPIFRKGITASHPAVDFNGKRQGMLDIACFPGSSGSPVFILNENGYKDKSGNFHMGGSRFIFIGILFAGPMINNYGEIQVETIPTIIEKNKMIVTTMMHLGVYIKASEILYFHTIIEPFIDNNITSW